MQNVEQNLEKNKYMQNPFNENTSTKKALKYAFFDAKTGILKYECGGIEKPITCQSTIGNNVKIYKLQALVKDTVENAFNPQLI